MPIFDQGYQHWHGRLSGHARRWLVITRHGVAAQWKNKAVKGMVIAALMPAGVLALFLIFWGLIEQQSSWVTPYLQFLNLPEEVREGPKGYREVYWTMAFFYFFNVESVFTLLLVLLVGPNLISQDLRYNAIPLYFSRPVRRFDYFLGKLGVIATFVAAVSIAPAVLAYALGVAFSLDATVIRDTGHILLASVAYGAVVAVSAGTLMLAISSLSRNSRMVGAVWVGLWIVSSVAGTVLANSVRQDWCPIVSYPNDLLRIREAMLRTSEAREKYLSLLDVGREKARRGFIPLPFRRLTGSRPLPRPVRPAGPPPMPGYDENGNSAYPWQWSAGVLAGLWVLSAWTLSTRVKSLDRLK
jgi:ABC-2 type transport system permease protein